MTEIEPIGSNGPKYTKSEVKSNNDKSSLKESLFLKLDKNKDGYISHNELAMGGYSGKELDAMSEALFFANRNVNKWFMLDKDKDGQMSNIEEKMWKIHNTDQGHKIGGLTPDEFAEKYKMKFIPQESLGNFEDWCKTWVETDDPMQGIKAIIKSMYGKELNAEETQLLYDSMKAQANRWLFKADSLYNQLNNSAYTRLVTDEQTVSCCGGDISKPPIGEQPKLNPDGTLADADSCTMIFSGLESDDAYNTDEEVKNRLAWAAFKTVPQEVAAKMSPEEYKAYQKSWEAVRSMKASDYRELLKPENKSKLDEFEKTSNMTVEQIVRYIDIIESATGKDFDSAEWEVNSEMFHNDIMDKINGSYGDESLLQGKTRSDIPPERQAWLRYLEEHNLLFDQFKE